GGVEGAPHDGRDRDGRGGQELGIHVLLKADRSGGVRREPGGVRREVVERDEAVGLAAAERRLKPNDRGAAWALPGCPSEGLSEQAFQSAGGMRVREESDRVLVDGVGGPSNHVLELGREHLVSELAGEHVGTRLTPVEDGPHRLGTSGWKVDRSVAAAVTRDETQCLRASCKARGGVLISVGMLPQLSDTNVCSFGAPATPPLSPAATSSEK